MGRWLGGSELESLCTGRDVVGLALWVRSWLHGHRQGAAPGIDCAGESPGLGCEPFGEEWQVLSLGSSLIREVMFSR